MSAEKEDVWLEHAASSHLADIIERAVAGHHQIIRGRSQDEVVVISRAEYEALTAGTSPIPVLNGPPALEGLLPVRGESPSEAGQGSGQI